ncbi:hypothetical protein CHLRE_10g429000v5 [Chlamydomonas reinhardtii]|uniref:UBC core domain-containing protein n=1 Tax=Chlamydomonas reinhardtii TaxID=3055 RepID=A0A2K3D9R2_CHLRE|nr:uncharacterized protein CHLRE_10g429000v5 [Chlamydomonas reinhardtii]PNW77265.1 hypothetical protein CHLRE_10g429000v5 [Chlamydomonas reinhardtii]
MAALPTPPCASAVRRLQRDLRQWALEKDELGIPALLQQLEPKDGLSRVAINMSPKEGPFADCVFHLHVTFPPDYPHRPPDVRLMEAPPGFTHPNIFRGWHSPLTGDSDGYYICLDMIKLNALAGPYKRAVLLRCCGVV